MKKTGHARVRALALALGTLVVGSAGVANMAVAEGLRQYQTRYYDLHTDLDVDGVRETVVRITAMAEEYYQRTKGFSGKVSRRLPFYLFTDPLDYYAAGGMLGSAGVFTTQDGGRLMAIAGDKPTDRTWHVVQHEGFHQFVHSVIRGDIPVWVNEGLAEYFGEGIYTGDGFVVGIVPPDRLERLKEEIDSGRQKSINEMMAMSHEEWNSGLAMTNYNQGWSMIHFLVHGDDGKYVKALNAFLNDISNRRVRYENSWVKNFGRDIKGFEKCYRYYWTAQKPDCTEERYAQAVIATMTSYFARAVAQNGMKARHETAEAFFAAAEAGELKNDPRDWLPPRLLSENLPKAKDLGKWAIVPGKAKKDSPALSCTIGEGKTFVGTFVAKDGKIQQVTVAPAGAEAETSDNAASDSPTTDPPTPEPVPTSAPTTAPAPVATSSPTGPGGDSARPLAADPVRVAISLAKSYHSMGRDDRARQLLTDAIRKAPDSPLVAEAKALLESLK